MKYPSHQSYRSGGFLGCISFIFVTIMKFFFVKEALAPLRSEPKESSEMVSQLLFGEKGEILDNQDSWMQIRNEEDQYVGWVDSQLVMVLERETVHKLQHYHFVREGALLLEDKSPMRLPPGARIPVVSEQETHSSFRIGAQEWDIPDTLQLIPLCNYSDLTALAEMYLNTPYLWGGRSGWGIDCSGFVQLLYRMIGVFLPRDAYQQAELGECIDFKDQQPGDLAFFRKANQNRITHVGMIVSNETIIHASGKVRLDFLKENGIIRVGNNQLTHNLVFIKRM